MKKLNEILNFIVGKSKREKFILIIFFTLVAFSAFGKSYVKSEYDDLTGVTTIYNSKTRLTNPHFHTFNINVWEGLTIDFQKKQSDDDSYFILRADYYGRGWIFFNTVYIYTDNKNLIEIKNGKNNRNVENDGYVWETNRYVLSKNDVEKIKELLSKDKVYCVFVGDSHRTTKYEIKQKYKDMFLEILNK